MGLGCIRRAVGDRERRGVVEGRIGCKLFNRFVEYLNDGNTVTWPCLPVGALVGGREWVGWCGGSGALWFSRNGLVINPDKFEDVSLSTVQHARAVMLPFTSIDIAGPIVQLTDNVKMLTLYLGGGFVVVNILTFEKQVQSVCKSANYRIGSKGTKTHPVPH